MPQIVGGDFGQCLIYLRKYHLDWSNKCLKNCVTAAVRGPMNIANINVAIPALPPMLQPTITTESPNPFLTYASG